MSIQELAAKNCKPCEGTEPFNRGEVALSLHSLPGWTLRDNTIEKEFRFGSYLDGLGFACAVGRVAEKQDHHPDILIGWRRVKLSLSTHSIKGLSQNDFIIAAKSEVEYRKFASS